MNDQEFQIWREHRLEWYRFCLHRHLTLEAMAVLLEVWQEEDKRI